MPKYDLRDDFLDRLVRIGYAVEAECARCYAPYGLDRITAYVLGRLREVEADKGLGAGMRMGEFAKELKCAASSVTEAVDRLELHTPALVECARDPTDGRARQVTLTVAGRVAADAYMSCIEDLAHGLLRKLRQPLKDALTQLEGKLDGVRVRRKRVGAPKPFKTRRNRGSST